MRVTVCELPHEPVAMAFAWNALCEHTYQHASEIVLLPEFAMAPPVWEADQFDKELWTAVEAQSKVQLGRLRELRAKYVVGTRPITIDGCRFNQGYLWSAANEIIPLRSKHFLPAEAGSWESQWFEKGDAAFPAFRADELSFGLNICTELWALETYAAYAALGVQVIMSPRATSAATTAKWLSVGVVAAVRSGAYSVSSNRVDPTGACGGGGWIVSPDGRVLACTTAEMPFATIDLDLTSSVAARSTYPRYVFGEKA